jgi:hypothetical protein
VRMCLFEIGWVPEAQSSRPGIDHENEKNGADHSLKYTFPRRLVDLPTPRRLPRQLGVVEHDEDVIGSDMDVCTTIIPRFKDQPCG